MADVCHFARLPRFRLIARFRVSHWALSLLSRKPLILVIVQTSSTQFPLNNTADMYVTDWVLTKKRTNYYVGLSQKQSGRKFMSKLVCCLISCTALLNSRTQVSFSWYVTVQISHRKGINAPRIFVTLGRGVGYDLDYAQLEGPSYNQTLAQKLTEVP